MPVDRDWLRTEAVRLGLALSEEDLAAIGDAIEKTRAALVTARRDSPEWADPPVEFLPPIRGRTS